jgi:hypothetical protein
MIVFHDQIVRHFAKSYDSIVSILITKFWRVRSTKSKQNGERVCLSLIDHDQVEQRMLSLARQLTFHVMLQLLIMRFWFSGFKSRHKFDQPFVLVSLPRISKQCRFEHWHIWICWWRGIQNHPTSLVQRLVEWNTDGNNPRIGEPTWVPFARCLEEAYGVRKVSILALINQAREIWK